MQSLESFGENKESAVSSILECRTSMPCGVFEGDGNKKKNEL